mgnify:CR=1 FL=1
MTKKLEDLLNLPSSKEIVEETKLNTNKADMALKTQEPVMRDIAEFDKIAGALPAVKGLGEMADTELNEIADKALNAYEDLMDLGMNVESRYSARIFEVAGQMLKTNLEAKTAKLDKKLKMVELQLKKQKQDQKTGDVDSNVISGEGYVVSDRNSLIEKLKNLDKYNKDGNNDKDDK